MNTSKYEDFQICLSLALRNFQVKFMKIVLQEIFQTLCSVLNFSGASSNQLGFLYTYLHFFFKFGGNLLPWQNLGGCRGALSQQRMQSRIFLERSLSVASVFQKNFPNRYSLLAFPGSSRRRKYNSNVTPKIIISGATKKYLHIPTKTDDTKRNKSLWFNIK